MADWIEYAKIAGAFVGAGGVATVAKLYHDKVVTEKNVELKSKDAEIARIRAELVRAEGRARSAEADSGPGARELAKLREQLIELIERLAKAIGAQAASLYIPLFGAHDDDADVPRGFAFVAVYNVHAGAAAAVLRMKRVESWTIVGECWTKGSLLVDNDLQANLRHVTSYDQQSGFVPVHTIVAPVRWQGRQVGVLQVLNKTAGADGFDIDPRGFGAGERKTLADALQETTEAGIAVKTHYFLSNPDCLRFLGLRDELQLENAVIMSVDLTRSSLLYRELPLLDAARLIHRFHEYVHQRTAPFAAVVERFSGDGTMLRFHYGGSSSELAAVTPVLRAVRAAAQLAGGFRELKSGRWKELPGEVADAIKLRVSLTLGPVISTNVGPRQFQTPTVLGQCVNRSAKLVAYAPRDRDVVLVDDNARKALLQVDRRYADALRPFAGWSGATADDAASLAGHEYFEVALEQFQAG